MGSDSKNSHRSSNHNDKGNVAGVPLQIPAAAKKTVQNLKEILNKNCTDGEIYAVLLDCNMDPDDAIQRLLSQDNFKEVKSKRGKRKEMKETQESRGWSNSVTADRGVKWGSEQAFGRTCSPEDNHNGLGKTASKREVGSAAMSGYSSSIYRPAGKIISEQPPIRSDFFNADNRRQLIGTGDSVSSSAHSSVGHQPIWQGISKGQVSLADIVRGRPPNKGSEMSSELSCISQAAVLPNSSQFHNISSQVLLSSESELHEDSNSSHSSNYIKTIHAKGKTGALHDFGNQWPVVEHLPLATGHLVIGSPAISDADEYPNRICLYSDRDKLSRHTEADDVQISEKHYDWQNQSSNYNVSASTSHRQFFADGAGEVSNEELLRDTNSYGSRGRTYQEDLSFPTYSAFLNDEFGSAVSSAVANLQQLSIEKENQIMPPTQNHSAVVLPNHLQTFAADCSHLSFGTYKSRLASSSLATEPSNPRIDTLEVSAADGPPAVHSNFRNSEYRGDGQFGFMHDTEGVTAKARNYDPPVSSQPELMKQDFHEATREQEYLSTLALPDTSINDIQHSVSNFPFMVDPTVRKIPSVPSETHLENLPSGLLAPTRQSLKMRDSSTFLASQSVPSGYDSAVSSHTTIPMSEGLYSGKFSLPQLSRHTLPGSSLARGAVLPQRQPAHSYSQSIFPPGKLGNMTDYPFMPQRQTYVPSALQQASPEASVFHDSLASMNYDLPQYRSSVNMGGLPLSNKVPSAYESFLGISTVPGSFSRNQSALPMSSAVGYNDSLHSDYTDGNSLPRQQSNRSSTWDLGGGRQTSSVFSDEAYYRLLGQNQHRSGYLADQQAALQYESLGYPNTYHSERSSRASVRRPW